MLEQRRREFDEHGGMPTVPAYDPDLLPRLHYLMWVESMVNVGCHFGPNDLEASTWDQLIALAVERQFVEKILSDRRDKRGQQDVAADKARQQTGIPKPGATLFKPTKPFKGPTR